jgi:hypothetical protein
MMMGKTMKDRNLFEWAQLGFFNGNPTILQRIVMFVYVLFNEPSWFFKRRK